jgi:integrase
VARRKSAAMTAWSDAVDGWAGWCRAAGHSERSIYYRSYVIRQFASYLALGQETPWQVSLADVTQFVGRPGLKPETRRSYGMTLRSFYRWALDMALVDVDPTVRLPKVRIPDTAPRPAAPAVVAEALAHATDRDRLVVLLASLAGLRRAEIAGLRWEDVASDGIRVHGKGGKIRVVPLHPTLAGELTRERERRRSHGRFGTGYRYHPEGPDAPWVFPGPKGGPMLPDGLGKAATTALGGLGVHTLRHRFATNAYNGTRDLLALQQLLGHSKPETTTRYARASTAALEATVLAAAGDQSAGRPGAV